jgi:hypothetical protein
MLEWRGYQVYTCLLNECLSLVVFPTLTASWCILIIVGAYTVLRLFGAVDLPMYLLFALLLIDGILVVNFLLKFCGDVNEASVDLRRRWRSLTLASKEIRLAKRQIRSCVPLKIKCGSSNYFEVSTPLVIMDLCLEQVVKLLID